MPKPTCKKAFADKTVMHLFATKALRDDFNLQKLSEQASDKNPAALVKSIWKSAKSTRISNMASHYDDPPPSATLICRNAVVRLKGKNIEPDFGLYNNAIGTVKEIVFPPGKDPNNGDQPSYVAVRFESYCGPAWCESDPKIVPIPMLERRCNKGCCTVTFCPLLLSYGMTAHTFQGQSAGPVDEGQPKNAVDCIVLDPGDNKFEGNNPGTLYMGVSRATTMGTGSLDSALYFTGRNMNRYRVLNLKLKRDDKTPYKKVRLRDSWVAHLDANTVILSWTEEEKRSLLDWANTFTMSTSDLEKALTQKNWRKSMIK